MQKDGFKMTNLYKRILYTKDDDLSLAFIGITNGNLSPAIVQEYQAQWYTQVVVLDQCQQIHQAAIDQEIATREARDKTADYLGLQKPAYCNSLAKEIPGCRGFWMQMFVDRLPLLLKSLSAQWLLILRPKFWSDNNTRDDSA